jgi:glycosyltransferase involved in cell wall biosynthesis
MNVVIALEQRFVRTPDGHTWTETVGDHAVWTRYLTVFDHVSILARVRDRTTADQQWKQVDGKGVSVLGVPHYVGPWQFLRRIRSVRVAVSRAVVPGGAYILRVPGMVGTLASQRLNALKYPFGLEVVADPWDLFSPGTFRTVFRPFFRRWFIYQLRHQCLTASANLYVTQHALQARYPSSHRSGRRSLSVGVSDVEIPEAAFQAANVEMPESAFARASERRGEATSRFRIISVGSLERSYKGADVLINAISSCIRAGLDVELVLVGDGHEREKLARTVNALGISSRVQMLGHLPSGARVRNELDAANLFVLASRQEGLPRAMIEAMARSLPCIGTTVGGIPELLQSEALVPPNDADALARKITEFIRDKALREGAARRNFNAAQRYREEVLQPRREAFYRHLEYVTKEWRQ